MKILKSFELFWKIWNLKKILKSYENIEYLGNFLNLEICLEKFWTFFFLILEFWNFLNILKFYEIF